jgi:hypothetical protein
VDVLHGDPEAPQEGLDSRQCHQPRDDDRRHHQAPDHPTGPLKTEGLDNLWRGYGDHDGRDEDTVQDRAGRGPDMIDSHGTHDR